MVQEHHNLCPMFNSVGEDAEIPQCACVMCMMCGGGGVIEACAEYTTGHDLFYYNVDCGECDGTGRVLR